MQAFLDESGTHAGSRVTAMAGYVIDDDALLLLETEWIATLQKYGMDELHMREFVPPYGKYSHWDGQKKRETLEGLVRLVHKHSLIGVGAALEMTHFMSTSHAFAHSKSPALVASPYEWCFRYCAVQAASWADSCGKVGAIDYLLDDGCNSRGSVYERFQMSLDAPALREGFRLGSLNFGNSKTSPALQCADLLAYEMYREADRVLSHAARPPRGSFLALFRNDDRLVTIKRELPEREVGRGMQIPFAMLGHLPPTEKFQVMCYALRHMTPGNREILFGMNPFMRNIYAACLAKGEMGKRLDELPRELLPPDDSEWFRSRGVDLFLNDPKK